MEHIMGLYEGPFQSIKSGNKTVEVRLNDEKRRKLHIGDTIKFTKVPGKSETLTVEVNGLKVFPTFKEMYEAYPASAFDPVGDPVDLMVEQTYEIYTPEQEKKWGTLAINVSLLEDSINNKIYINE